MGFTKKTWLALALAIVLVLGLSISASAAPSITVVASPTELKTSGSSMTSTITSTNADLAPGSNITLTLPTSGTGAGVLKLASSSLPATQTAGTPNNSWVIEAVKPGRATVTVTSGATTATCVITVKPEKLLSSAGMEAGGAPKAIIVKSSYKEDASFYVTDAATTPNTIVNIPADGVSYAADLTGDPFITSPTYNGNTGTITFKGIMPGTTEVTFSGNGLTPLVIPVIVLPDEIKIAPTDPADADPWTMYGTGANVGQEGVVMTKEYILTDSNLNPIEGATLTSSAATIATTDPTGNAVTGSNGLFTITGVAAGKAKITAKIGPTGSEVTATTGDVTILDPKKAQAFDVQKQLETAVYDPAKDADKKPVDYVNGDNAYVFTVSGIFPQTAEVITELGDPAYLGKPAGIKWTTSTSKNVKITVPAVDATAGTVKAGEELKSNQAKVQFVKTGTAKLTVKIDDAARTFTFDVKTKKADGIAAIPDMNLMVAQYKQVKPQGTLTVNNVPVPSDVRSNYTFKSDNKKAATVGKTSGVIKGVKVGTAKITVTDTVSGKKVSFKVTVGKDYSTIQYRGAALISDYDSVGHGAFNSDYYMLAELFDAVNYDGKTAAMKDMRVFLTENSASSWLKSNEAGKGFADFKTAYDATSNQSGVKEDDVFIFYFAGDIDATGKILLEKKNDVQDSITVDELFTQLTQIPCTVFVVMDGNMSSLALNNKGVAAITPAQFNNMVINTAAKKSLQAKTIGTAASAAGSFKQKFKVLVSTSKKSQTSNMDALTIGTTPETVTFKSRWFTRAFIDGLVGGSILSKMPADANRNRFVTLKELYNYVNKAVKADVAAYNKGKSKSEKVKQAVSVYPAKGDAFPVYARVAPIYWS